MGIKRSLSLKFVSGFLIVITPLVLLLFYVIYYSTNVIRLQVSQSNHNLLSMYVEQIDKSLEATSTYIYKTISHNPDIYSIDLYKYRDADYVLAKYNILNNFNDDIRMYSTVESFFIYIKSTDDLTGTAQLRQSTDTEEKMQLIKKAITTEARKDWYLIQNENGNFLIRAFSFNNNTYVGAYVNIDKLIASLKFLHLEDSSVTMMVSGQGVPLVNNAQIQEMSFLQEFMRNESNALYQVQKDPEEGINYLIIGVPSKLSELWLIEMVPEEKLLSPLILLKRIIYISPGIIVIILLIYIYLLQRILVRPMNALIKGMKRITKGDLEVRLPNNLKGEFSFLIGNFNNMVSQIQNLKINIYEEKLRTQQAEYKHLQLQINPHFYMNTLNIIYNLAAIKDYKAVQKMSLHLASYFRFIMQTKKSFICLKDEIGHIENYLEIQKLRFPNGLTYQIDVPTEYLQYRIPPLTIQTFVENSIKHGYCKGKEKFHIRVGVNCYDKGEETLFEVLIVDNGKGFTQNQLEEFHSGEYYKNIETEQIGISNAYRRLKMKYGSHADILFENGKEQGAIVHIVLPVATMEDEGGQKECSNY